MKCIVCREYFNDHTGIKSLFFESTIICNNCFNNNYVYHYFTRLPLNNNKIMVILWIKTIEIGIPDYILNKIIEHFTFNNVRISYISFIHYQNINLEEENELEDFVSLLEILNENILVIYRLKYYQENDFL